MHTLTILAPVFLIILLGVILRWSDFLSGDAPRVLSRYCYWVALPALLFLKIGAAHTQTDGTVTALMVCVGVTISLGIAGLATGFALRLPPRGAVTLMHTSMRGNLAYVGLPIVMFAFADHPQAAEAEAMAALVIGPLIILYNIVPSVAHVMAAHSGGHGLIRKVILKLITNPLILACIGGLIWNRTAAVHNTDLPLIAVRSLNLMGISALPLALLSVGSTLADTRTIRAILPAISVTAFKNVLAIVLTLGFARWLNASAVDTGVALILMAAPTAVASMVLVEELSGDPNIAASAIALTTLCSLFTLPLALSFVL